MALTKEQVDIVKSTAPVLEQHGAAITTVFYRNLLASHPELKNVFSLRNQETGAQQNALAKSVLAYARHIDQLGRLGSVAERIAQKHCSLEAWIAAYQQLADLLIGRERQLYNEAGTWQTWRRFRIARKEPDNESVTNFYLEPVDGEPLPQYLPGQYVSLQLPIPTGGQAPAQPPAATAAGDRDDNDGRGHHHHCILQSRQYSLSEAPTPGMSHYCISVKREKTMADAPLEDVASGKVPGIMSNLLHNDYGVGSEVDLSPPRGDFYVDPSDARKSKSPLILLSAGVGAAPLRAILDSTLANPLHRDRPVTWLHTARRSATICFSQHVRNAASKHGNLEASIYVRDLCGSDIRDIIHDFHGALPLDPVDTSLRLDNKDAEYYICGPEAWMLELSHWLESLGVDQERQHLELFRPGSLR
ncbi:hypothetical protein N3K66_004619 [Trichothecium roseum]|uniref:Uncharacterized protein n=1 Tax=Trichothecium roseum TaxID=47278 RepID=A0ACC0V2B3_9HYPO|nr:hypothetical protein N3K66_004619 [Trichothecium roseum]